MEGTINTTNEHLVKHLEVKEYYVASLDILGAKEYIINDKGNMTFNLVYNTFQNAKSQLEKEDIQTKTWLNEAECKIFSDNIVIYLKSLKGKRNTSVFQAIYFINLIRRIQYLFLVQRLLIRGGITIGEFFGDNMMVWGKALVEVYELESKCAIYPRIILSPKYIKHIGDMDNVSDIALLDKDEIYYLDIIYFHNALQRRFESLIDEEEKRKIIRASKIDINKTINLRDEICIILKHYEEKRVCEEKQNIQAKYDWVISHLKTKLEFLNKISEICSSLEGNNKSSQILPSDKMILELDKT